ncbi:MAG: T9SS type A sorting domain-containing protein [Bacteroidetes bacterium]|nr:MAG: T9SS type A sorting domain-containing protein [Bacteroidota bacterium]
MNKYSLLFTGLILTGVFFLTYTGSYSEDIQKSWYSGFENTQKNNFFELQKNFNEYWKDKTPAKGSGWKVFKRWEYFWEQRLDSTAKPPDMVKIYQNWNNYLAKNKHKETLQASNFKWTFLGPSSPPFKSNNQDPAGVGIGRMNCITFDPVNPNILWAGAAYGGVWKSTNSGSSWRTFPFTEFMSIGITDIAVSPANPNIVYVATGDADGSLSGSACYSIGVLKTIDSGNTWTTTGLQSQIQNGVIINRLIIHPTQPDTLFAATTGGLYASYDGGTNWFQMINAYFRDLEFKPDNPNIIFAAGVVTGQNNQLLYTVVKIDLVASQYSYNFSFPANEVLRMAIAVSPANPNYIYALSTASDLGFHSVVKSTDGGTTWNIVAQRSNSPNYLHENWAGTGNGGQGHYDLAIEVSKTNANEVYIGGVNIWKSTDGGVTWSLNAEWTGMHSVPWIHADQHDLEFSPTGELFSANDGGITKSTNGGLTWSELNNGLAVTEFYRLSSAPSTQGIVYCGSQDNGTHRLLAREWKNVLGGDGMECLVDPNNPDFVYTSLYYGDFHRSTNGGNSFAPMLSMTTTNEQAGWVTPLVMDTKFPAVLYAGYQNVWKTTNRGLSWNRLGAIDSTGIIRAIAIAPSDNNTIYVSKQGGIWVSTNAGQTWERIITGGIITGIAVSPTNPKKFWFSNSGYGDSLKVYEMDVNNLTNISGSLPNVPVNCIIYQNNSPDRLYIGTDVGVFYRDNRFSDWQLFQNGLPNVVISELDIHYASKKIRAATYGRGLWENDLIECNAPLPKINSAKKDICRGDSVKLELTAPYKTYDWSTGETTNFIWIKDEGTYTVTVTDSSDCTYTSEPVNIIVHEIPGISVKVTNGTTTFCDGDSVTLQGNPNFTFSSWVWSDGQTGRNIVAKKSGSYTVTGTTSYGCKNTSAAVDVTVNPAPDKPTITKDGNTLMSSLAHRYQWYRNDTLIVLATNQYYLAKKDGKYSVKVFNELDCGTISDQLDVILGIDDESENNIVLIQPNPTQGYLNIIINDEPVSNCSIEITNIQGEKLFTINNIKINENYLQTIDIHKFPTGVYFVKVNLGNKVIIRKLIKE